MSRFSKSISEVAGWTMASRLLGLARDILLFAALGTGPLNSAFILAFTLPNLFRRLLGEGALTSSSIPVLSETLAKRGREETFQLMNSILTRLGLGLLLLTVIAFPLFALVAKIDGLAERWYIGAELSRILFPYVLFICLGALVCGLLNVLGRFGLAAFNQVWLNLAMIGSLLLGIQILSDDPKGRVLVLSAGVLLGGVLQLIIPGYGLARQGWKPAFSLKSHPELNKILKLFIPGMLGAAIFQINILISRMLAFSLDDSATGLLYLSSRLVELPLGVFAIAVSTVVFPELSRLSSLGSEEAFSATFRKGLSVIFTITLPAAVGLSILSQPILGFLFQWGLFDSKDVAAASPVLIASSIGLPFFAWSTMLTRAWYSRQSMVIPVRLAMVNLVLNLVLGLLFMRYWGATGLAAANTVSGAVHCLALHIFLRGVDMRIMNINNSVKLILSLILLAAFVFYFSSLTSSISESRKISYLLTVSLTVPLGASVYFGFLWLVRFNPLKEFLKV